MDKAKLFEDRMPRAEVEIPNLGTATVRGVSRMEMMLTVRAANPSGSQEPKDIDTQVFERKLLFFGLVDPSLTEAEVERWYAVAPTGELNPVLERIRELSGLGENAHKEAYKSVRGESDS